MPLKRQFLLTILGVFLLTACSSKPVSQSDDNIISGRNSYDTFFSSFPSGGNLVFIGASGKRSNPQETIQLALENAAVKAGMFFQVTGEYAMQNNVGSGAFDYSYNTKTVIFFDLEGSKQYTDTLQYNLDTDTIEIENTLFVRTTYPASLPISYRPRYTGADRKPDWIDNPPLEIDGYHVGLGYSGRYSSIKDTFDNSRNNAIFSIIRNINTVAGSSDMLYMETGNLFGYKTSNENITYSFGTLYGFYILDTWIDPKSLTVWTLAIAKK